MTTERVHYYHADGSPIGGHLTHPSEIVIPSHGSVSLNQAGGHAEMRVDAYKLDGIMSTGAASSQATGSVAVKTRNWTTFVTSTVEKVNVMEVVTADRIVAQMELEHPREGDYPKVGFLGCKFENLRINGKPVSPHLDLDIASLSPTSHKAAAEGHNHPVATTQGSTGFPDRPWPEVPSFVEKAVAQSERIIRATGVPDWLKRRYEWMTSEEARRKKGYVLCSLVDSVSGADPGVDFGHVLVIPNFGSVFLGEMVVDAKSFQLTMLRVEMNNTAVVGNTGFAAAVANGRGMP